MNNQKPTKPENSTSFPVPSKSALSSDSPINPPPRSGVIDAVVNIWTAESLAIRPNRDAFFGGKMGVSQEILKGITIAQMVERMDRAGVERLSLIHISEPTRPY